jgi:hypothetical protein
VKLTDDELRRLRLDAPPQPMNPPESFGGYLTRERFNSIIDELLAARRVVEAAHLHLIAAVSTQKIIDAIVDYEKVTR